MSDGWHLYLLRCRDGSLYAGIATDVERRFREHAAGKGAKYTRAHPPECVLASRAYPDRASASRAEHALKRLPKARKLDWLLGPASATPVTEQDGDTLPRPASAPDSVCGGDRVDGNGLCPSSGN